MMTSSAMFQEFISNLAIENRTLISARYERITAALNRNFRDTESKTANSLQVGSYGRDTGIKGLSDLDMIYMMPARLWDDYKDGGQYDLLADTKAAIVTTYKTTDVKVDRLVVVVSFGNYQIEVQPCFQESDGTFTYPDTYHEDWRMTNPRAEIKACSEMDTATNGNLRDLCKMVRAWRNKHGQQMGGLLIDTLAFRFFQETDDYDETGYGDHHFMVRDFFDYLANLPKETTVYKALGSGQHVKVKKSFRRKARKAHKLCLEAIDAEGQKNQHAKWRKVFGNEFPAAEVVEEVAVQKSDAAWNDTEQFIEDLYPVDIRYNIEMECKVTQNGYQMRLLTEMLRLLFPLLPNKTLDFYVTSCDVPPPYELKWKVLNRGYEAQKRNQVRGQIVNDRGYSSITEHTSFKGDHVVECYAIKNGVVVAKNRIHVPIQEQS